MTAHSKEGFDVVKTLESDPLKGLNNSQINEKRAR